MKNKAFVPMLILVLTMAFATRTSAGVIEVYNGEMQDKSPAKESHGNKALLWGGIALIGLGGAFLLAGYNDDGNFGKPDPSLTGLGWALTGGGALCIALSF
jgi:hypothetical protein